MIRGANLPRLAECRDCAEPIRFVRMATTGRNMPVNPAPITDGTTNHTGVAAGLRGNTLHGYVITPDRLAGDPRFPYRFTPHYATCEAKKSKPTPKPVEDPALF